MGHSLGSGDFQVSGLQAQGVGRSPAVSRLGKIGGLGAGGPGCPGQQPGHVFGKEQWGPVGKRDRFKWTTLEQFYLWSNEFVLLFIHSFTHSVNGIQ